MLRKSFKLLLVAVLGIVLTVATTGCKSWKYGIGWVSGIASMAAFQYTDTDQTCYRNGELVDCSEILDS